jgi:hypothetical protein
MSRVDNDMAILIRKQFVKKINIESSCNITFDDKIYLQEIFDYKEVSLTILYTASVNGWMP